MNERQRKALQHPDRLGTGAKMRKKLKGQEKVGVVMSEYKRGTLHSGSGEKVTNPKQAIAIALSEAGLSKKQKKSVHGSGEFSKAEIQQGFRRI